MIHASDPDSLGAMYGMRLAPVWDQSRGANHIFCLTDGNRKFFLRLTDLGARESAHIGFELGLLQKFSPTQSVSVSKPVAAKDGAHLHSFDAPGGLRFGCLFESADGRELEKSPADCTALGRALADFHQQADAAEPYVLHDHAARMLRTLAEIAEIDPQTSDTMREISQSALDGLSPLIPDIAHGVCHGDVWFGNARIESAKVTLFDFEDCGMGPQAFDLANLAMHFWEEPETAPDLWNHLLNGYREIRDIRIADRMAIFHFLPLCEIRTLGSLAGFRLEPPGSWDQVIRKSLGKIHAWLENDPAQLMAK